VDAEKQNRRAEGKIREGCGTPVINKIGKKGIKEVERGLCKDPLLEKNRAWKRTGGEKP